MSQPQDDSASGTYDDVPEDEVHTVLNIPLRLAPVGEEFDDEPRGRHRAAAPRTIVPAPVQRGRVRRFLESEHPVQAAVVVGASAAFIVFAVVAVVMLATTWLVK